MLSEYPYLFMLIKLWPKYWNDQLKSMNIKVDYDNGKALGMMNGRYRNFLAIFKK